jgi:hypothetical protein
MRVPPLGASPAFIHRIILSGVAADVPAMRKLALWLSHAAYLGCGWCWLRSVREDANANWWAGYTRPVPCGEVRAGAADEVSLAGRRSSKAEGIFVSEQQQLERGRRAEASGGADATCAALGSKGVSPIVSGLPYASYDLFVLPIAHACLVGVLKDFLGLIFAKGKRGQPTPWWHIPHAARAIMKARARQIVATDDFGRPYKCVVDARGHWVMEDYLHFAETFSLFIFSADERYGPVLHRLELQQMWRHLRSALLLLLRPRDVEAYGSAAAVAAAAEGHLWDYAEMAQQHFGRCAAADLRCKPGNRTAWSLRRAPAATTACRSSSNSSSSHSAAAHAKRPKPHPGKLQPHPPSKTPTPPRLLCKYNLHQLICRIVRQATLRGHSVFHTEYWGENYIQLLKSTTKYRSTAVPALVVVNSLLATSALTKLRLRFPDHTLTFDELIPAYRAGGMRGHNLDDGAADSGAQLLGSGRQPDRGQETEVRDSLQRRWGADADLFPVVPGWNPVWFDPEGFLVYQHAETSTDGFSLKSLAYLRAASRISHYCLVRYGVAGRGAAAPYVARIYYFVKASPGAPDAAQAAADAASNRARPTAGRRGRRPAAVAAAEAAAAAAQRAADSPPPSDLRFAVCDLYKAEVRDVHGGHLYFVRCMQQPLKKRACVLLSEFTLKLVAAGAAVDRRAAPGAGPGMFMAFENWSRTTLL